MEKFKTRSQIALELGISRRTFTRWLKKDGIKLSKRMISPKEQKIIYEKYGLLQGEFTINKKKQVY